jgi:hypothetical protein
LFCAGTAYLSLFPSLEQIAGSVGRHQFIGKILLIIYSQHDLLSLILTINAAFFVLLFLMFFYFSL